MGRRRYTMRILGAIFCIVVAAAIVWFCVSGGKRQTKQNGTLVQLDGIPCRAAVEQSSSSISEEAA